MTIPRHVLPQSASRQPMIARFLKPFVVALLLAGISGFGADERSADDKRAAAVLRGRYLVERVGMCADCHSPRNEKGQFVMDQWLRGAPLGFAPTVPMPAWAPTAPAIAGLGSMTEEEAVKFFMTGARADGSHAKPPMPEYRFNREDAVALTAYLKTLGTR